MHDMISIRSLAISYAWYLYTIMPADKITLILSDQNRMKRQYCKLKSSPDDVIVIHGQLPPFTAFILVT